MKKMHPTSATAPACLDAAITLRQKAEKTLTDYKAQNVVAITMHAHTTLMDFLLICTAGSERHARALSQQLRRMAKQNQHKPIQLIGEAHGQWVVVDLGDVVVHIMLKAVRDYYQIEKMWDMPPPTSDD